MAWRKTKNHVLFLLASSAFWLVGRLPPGLARWLGSVIGGLGYLIAAGERRKSLKSLAIAFPDLDDAERRRIARRCFSGLGRSAAEVCGLHRLDLMSSVEIDEPTRVQIDSALGRGRGLIWVTAHLGNWELLAAGLAARGYDVRPVATPSYDPRFTALIDRWRRERGVRTLWRDRGDLAEGISRALAEGAILGLLIDQDTRTKGVFVPFFGRQAWTPVGAAELARRTGAPAVAGFVRRRPGGGHRIETTEIELAREGDPAEVDRRNTAAFTAAIEAAVRARPADWVWMHQRWRTRPGEKR